MEENSVSEIKKLWKAPQLKRVSIKEITRGPLSSGIDTMGQPGSPISM